MQWALLPTAILLAFSQFHVQESNRAAIAGVVAGIVAMVPEGLVLLTSLAFGVAAVALARRQVLIQELPAVEGLARVDVILLDKTGTLTEGAIRFQELHALAGDDPVSDALGALAADDNRNATMNALCEAFPAPDGWIRTAATPFSSGRKWSGATFGDHGTWVIGAPEMVWVDRDANDPVRAEADRLAAGGQRRLVAREHRRRARRRGTARRARGLRAAPFSTSRFVATRPTRCGTSSSRASGAW